MAKSISVYDVLVNFVSLITFMLDVGTDILVTVQFFENGDIVWGSLTAGFIAVPTLLIQIFSLKWHITDKTLTALSCLPHLFLFAPVQRYLRVIRLGLKARSTRTFYDIDRVYREQNDVCILRLLESFLEAAPQLCLQLYIILVTWNITPLAGLSMVSSLVSMAWALTAYSDGLRLAYRDTYHRSWCTLLTHWIWQTSMTAARVMALVMFATVFKAWVFLAAGLHWIAMTIWISVGGTDFGESLCERGLFQIAAGFMYIFCFLNLQEGQTRHRMLAFYLVMLLENTALVTVWFVYKDAMPVLDIVTPSVVFGGFLLGLLSLLIYYRFLHPSGPIYLYTIKSVVHNGVLNNQRDTYPGVFDITAGTQLSVLGSDIIELSRDMDHTTLSLSRISNRSSGTFSQQHLQLAWNAGLEGKSSSSDSSLDMMDIGTSHRCTQNGTLTSSRSASSTRQLIQGSRLSYYNGRELYHDQADRQNQMDDLESTANSRKYRPAHKVYTEKDIYGFHENRFNGTYYSPVRNNNDVAFEAVSLSPLDPAKLWEETAGRLRSPLVGKDNDSLSTLDASNLLEWSNSREQSASSWASYSQASSSHSVTVHTSAIQSGSRSRSNSRSVDQLESQSRPVRNSLRDSYLDSSLPDVVDRHLDSPVSDSGSSSGCRDTIPESISHPLFASVNKTHDRFSHCDPPDGNQNYFREYESPQIRLEDLEADANSEGNEDESGVYTNTSNKSDRRDLQYQDLSLKNCPEPVYAVPYADRAAAFHNTQSAPGPLRHKSCTSLGAHNRHRLQYGNNEDLPSVCGGVLPDTPWKLDYLNLEPLKTALLSIQYIPENKKQLVREYLNNLSESINESRHPSPMKVQEFDNSPARFGRSIDLFNSNAWHAVQQLVDRESLLSEHADSKNSTMPVSGRRSRRSLLAQDSSEFHNMPLSGDFDSGYQPFQRSYLDSQNNIKETSPYGMSRHSSKMSCIRGDIARGAPVRGSPMPVRNRSKDHIDRRRSREMDVALAKKSTSQTSLNGRYRKRHSDDNKENAHHTFEDKSTPKNAHLSQKYRHDDESESKKPSKRKSVELSEKNPRFTNNPNAHSVVSDGLCLSLTSSYRQAINNTNRSISSMMHSPDKSHSDLKLDDLHIPEGEGQRQCSLNTDRQPFQAIQNTPAFSPMGDNRRQDAKSQSYNTFSSTPKVSSSLHSLALIDMYTSPVVESPQEEHHSGSAQRHHQNRNKQKNIGRVKSVDYLR